MKPFIKLRIGNYRIDKDNSCKFEKLTLADPLKYLLFNIPAVDLPPLDSGQALVAYDIAC